MNDPAGELDRLADETGFSGVACVEIAGEVLLERAYGLADRDAATPNTVDTRFAIASGTKGLTALAVMRLVEEGVLELSTPARALLGDDLPLVPADVTVEHLLAHRSGIGDYLDEDAVEDITTFLLPVPVAELDRTEAYLPLLDGHPPVFAADARFVYCNSGYVLLALLAERAGGRTFPALVESLVTAPAGMHGTGFLRSDDLPPDAAVGYVAPEDDRTNAAHLPVVGSGDGGCYTTVRDLRALWAALAAGEVVTPDTYALMTRPRSRDETSGHRYGLGFWLGSDGDVRWLEGYDAGVSFLSEHDPSRSVVSTVVSNTTDGAWPLVRRIRGTFLG